MLWPICAICKILNVEIVESKCRETRDANKNDMAQVETHAINVIISCVALYYNKGASGTNYMKKEKFRASIPQEVTSLKRLKI